MNNEEAQDFPIPGPKAGVPSQYPERDLRHAYEGMKAAVEDAYMVQRFSVQQTADILGLSFNLVREILSNAGHNVVEIEMLAEDEGPQETDQSQSGFERRTAERIKEMNDRLNAWSKVIDANIDQRHEAEAVIGKMADAIGELGKRISRLKDMEDSQPTHCTNSAKPEFPQPSVADVLAMKDTIEGMRTRILQHRILIEKLWDARAYGIEETALAHAFEEVMHVSGVKTRSVDAAGRSVVPGCQECTIKNNEINRLNGQCMKLSGKLKAAEADVERLKRSLARSDETSANLERALNSAKSQLKSITHLLSGRLEDFDVKSSPSHETPQ
jgi:septal ring factor EnvC (AmiA/AmiB activator)